jgi:hypothetical protein
MSQFNPIHSIKSHLSRINFNIISSACTHKSPKCLILLIFEDNSFYILHLHVHATYPTHLIHFYLSVLTILREG